jgi:hypothetical protein
MDQQGWTAVLVLIAPIIIAVLKQSGFTKAQNSVIALAVCLAAGVIDAFYLGIDNPNAVAKTVLTVMTEAFATYKMIFQPFGFDDWLTEKTSIKK